MTKYTIPEKINAVKRYLEGKAGYKSLANSIGVSISVFLNWIRQYESHRKSI